MVDIDFIIPSFRSKEFAEISIKSFEKFKGEFNFRYIVVENSNDNSYKEDILSICENIVWIQHPTKFTNSEANASSIEEGLKHVNSKYIFLCHNDVAACHPDWMTYLFSKLDKEGHFVVGTRRDNSRMNALHISGILTTTELAKSVSMFPVYNEKKEQILDVGDDLTKHCIENNLKYFCCKSTENDNTLICKPPFSFFSVDRTVNDDGEVIFLHLGRGTPKQLGAYAKPNRVYFDEWVDFVKENILFED